MYMSGNYFTNQKDLTDIFHVHESICMVVYKITITATHIGTNNSILLNFIKKNLSTCSLASFQSKDTEVIYITNPLHFSHSSFDCPEVTNTACC